MTYRRNFFRDAKEIRDKLREASKLADVIHENEISLIQKLYEIDQDRMYVRYGFKSLNGFCVQGLKFSRLRSQSIVTKVRRYVPMVNIGNEQAAIPQDLIIKALDYQK